MASNYTANYHLNQWEPEDKVQRVDFNVDNTKIDAALAALSSGKADKGTVNALSSQVASLQSSELRLTVGSYTGTGSNTNTINLPFPPVFMLIQRCDGLEEQVTIFGSKATNIRSLYKGVYAIPSERSFFVTQNGNQIEIKATGGGVDEMPSIAVNDEGAPYCYMAIG